MVLSTATAQSRSANRASILLLYAEPPAAAEVFQRLSSAGYAVLLSPAETALERWHSEFDADLIVLLSSSATNGQLAEHCAAVRSLTGQPVMVLSDSCEEQLVARALEAGVDEFVSSAVGDRELVARIDALLRRAHSFGDEPMHLGGLVLTPADLSVEVHGKRLFLTPIEFRLLFCLASAPGKVFTHDALMSRVWGAEYVDSRHYLYLYIRYLREKLERDPKQPRLIVSEWGVGYRLLPPDHAA